MMWEDYDLDIDQETIDAYAEVVNKVNQNKGKHLMKVQGFVEKLSTKQGQGRNGPWTMFSINVNGEWYSCGFKAPNCQEGQYVEFDVVQKGQYKNAENVTPTQQASAPAGNGGTGAAPASMPVNKKDISIHFQSCRKDAIQTLGVLLGNDAVKLPAKQADKYDAALALIDELTARYYLRLDDVIAAGGLSEEDLVPAPEGA